MTEFNMKKTAERIRELRTAQGISQTKLAKEIGIASNTISQYEAGTSKTSLEVIVKLAVALGTTTDYLLGLTDYESPN